MQFKFLKEGALVIGKTLIIGDLHIGIETDFASKGVTIPYQTEKIQKQISKLVKQNKIKHLVFLGDLRHKLPLPSRQEQREVPEFLEYFTKKCKVSIIKGNHDGELEKLVPKQIEVYPSAGFIENEILFTHGRNKSMKGKYNTIIMSHIHPSIEFWSSGIRMVEPAWVRTKLKDTDTEVIILPSFTHLRGGAAINSSNFKSKCPILKKADLPNSDIYLLDGTYLGKLKDLRIRNK